ncbi:MAG: fused MFS/spermidine synthase [Blautia sp.]|nr:fused MFS/spermidine synthase [Blautia sp.]
MAVELGASRLLAPYFSSSQIVWTIIIGTIMIAMALGNVWGGRAADRNPDPARLFRRILVASLWTAAIPSVGKYVILGVSGLLVLTVDTGFLVLASFLSCMLLFVFPLFLLGTVTPSLVKYTVSDLQDNGRIVGTLGAMNTIGSILGTFLPTFVTIPAVGTAVTFYIFSGILLLLAGIFFIRKRLHSWKLAAAVFLFFLFAISGSRGSFAFWENGLAYEGESVYNYLQVKDTPERTVLSTNVLFGVQSVYMKNEGFTGMYYDYALLAPALASRQKENASLREMLILGMGTGTYAGLCRRLFPEYRITGVEIDPAITALARRYFALPGDIPVVTYDGRAFLQVNRKKYDVIMVDAYQDITIPFQMSSVEFFRMVKEHLTPDGILTVNLNMRSGKSGSINDWLCETIASVFPEVYLADVPGNTNRIVFAGNQMNTDQAGLPEDLYPPLQEFLRTVLSGLVKQEAKDRILTDDKAPVELLGMQVIDELIREELQYYKEIFRKEGFAGLLR